MKLYKKIYQIEILSEGEYSPDGLDEIAFDVVYGNISGSSTEVSSEVLSPSQMAKALENQESDPDFLLSGFPRWTIENQGEVCETFYDENEADAFLKAADPNSNFVKVWHENAYD